MKQKIKYASNAPAGGIYKELWLLYRTMDSQIKGLI